MDCYDEVAFSSIIGCVKSAENLNPLRGLGVELSFLVGIE